MPVSNMPVSNMPVSNMALSKMPLSDMAAQGMAGTGDRGSAALRGGLAVDPAGLAELRSAAGRDDPEALLAAARQFEALLVGKMLESMRATVPENPLTGGRDVATFQSMLDSELAQDLVAGRGFGLAEALVRELGGGAQTVARGAEGAERANAPAAAPGLARYRAVAGEGAGIPLASNEPVSTLSEAPIKQRAP